MVYLKEALKGDAATIIANSPSTAAGYDEAWKKVEARYSNKREIVFSHLRKFHQLKIQPDSSVGLRKLCDTVNGCVRSLTLLQIQVDKWDVIMVFLSLTKLEEETKKQWLLTQGNELPKLSELLEYLEKRATALTESPKSTGKGKLTQFASSHHTIQGDFKKICVNCGKDHPLHSCPHFKFLSAPEKSAWVKKENNVCFNCLGHHHVNECKSKKSCQHCGKRHHTLLHFDRKSSASAPTAKSASAGSGSSATRPSISQNPPKEATPSSSSQGHVTSGHTSSAFSSNSVVLMATLVVKVLDSHGQFQPCRVFLDSGSEANFVSENMVSRLGLKREQSCVKVTGIGGSTGTTARGIVEFSAHSHPLVILPPSESPCPSKTHGSASEGKLQRKLSPLVRTFPCRSRIPLTCCDRHPSWSGSSIPNHSSRIETGTSRNSNCPKF